MPINIVAGLPIIGVLPSKYITGANNLNDDVPALTMVSFIDALTTPWATDAHFVAYIGKNTREDGIIPRCNKPLLQKVRLMGGDLLTTMFVLDYDNPNHGAWKAGQIGEFYRQLSDLADVWPLAWDWTAMYLTRGGARLIYVLQEPIPVDEAESKHLWLCQEFTRRGLAFDCAVSDWTRCFRLPFVVRDKEFTWESDYAEITQQLGNRLDAKPLPKADRITSAHYGEIEVIDRPKPEVEDAKALIESTAKGYVTQTDFYKIAKQRLKGRECFPCLFEHAQLAASGSRDATLHQYVGQAVSLLHLDGVTAEHVYSLFLPAVQQLEPDSGTPDWSIVLWSAVCRLWAKEDSKTKLEEKIAVEKAEESVQLFQRILRGMREWCKHPALHGDDQTAIAWAISKMIVSVDRSFYVMSPTGYYDPLQVNITQLLSRIRTLGLDSFIETRRMNKDGSVQDISAQTVVNRFSTIVRTVRAVPQIEGAYVENMDENSASMVIPAFSRNKALVPMYDADVDEWLHQLFGAHYEIGAKWLSWALAFEEGPICALSIVGEQGSGKKMLVTALKECLTIPELANAEDLTSSYQYGLLKSPFLVVNEGWTPTGGGMHPADKFRALVGGDPQTCNTKYNSPVEVRNPVRVIFTANNMDVVRMLAGNRDLSPEDREALSLRLLHINLAKDASDWLRMKGGVAFTAKEGRRWISGDGGQDSDYIVARHFLWLHANRKKPVGARFLVEGNNASQVMFDMRTASGSSPLVIETIISMLECKGRTTGCKVIKSRLYLLVAGILQYYRQEVAHATREKLTSNQISKVLRGLVRVESDQSYVLEGQEDLGRRRWCDIDCKLLLTVAQRDGWPCPRLEKIVMDQEARDRGEDVKPDIEVARKPNQKAPIDFGIAVRDLQLMQSQMVVEQGPPTA